MPEPKMFCIELTTQPPAKVMLYAVSKTQAWSEFRDTFGKISEASGLQVAAHVRAGLPIIGEPAQPDPNQQPLQGV
jgi:hypothetical protein